jgi:hypothetical protein
VDVNGLIKFINEYDFENSVFNHPITDQTEIYTEILKLGFEQLIPVKTITIRPSDAPWCNSYKAAFEIKKKKKNRYYHIYKKI